VDQEGFPAANFDRMKGPPDRGDLREFDVTHEIRYVPTALEHLRELSARERATVLDTVDDQLRHQPAVATRIRKPMRPDSLAAWELRIGDLRVFYDVHLPEADDEDAGVVVLAVGRKVGNRLWIGGEEQMP
jgi:mRNA-degrading endonuclease RelE of RelBE toxin-antitoxin system